MDTEKKSGKRAKREESSDDEKHKPKMGRLPTRGDAEKPFDESMVLKKLKAEGRAFPWVVMDQVVCSYATEDGWPLEAQKLKSDTPCVIEKIHVDSGPVAKWKVTVRALPSNLVFTAPAYEFKLMAKHNDIENYAIW